ncbi:MAG TPA: hypothetical protein VF666_19855 [Pyrinomonadaceae bacterium]|jgi:hypothetical protein
MSNIFSTVARLLRFRLTREEFAQFDYRHLLLGLLSTWVVGMGRWWDDPGAHMLQHLGVGSLIYIFILSLMLWLVVLPLKPKAWSYVHVLTFVALTSPPAILYAIPVEKFMSLDAARILNVLFLCVVATWRVALLIFYLIRHAELRAAAPVAAFLPITAIVVSLTVMNLERAAYVSMSGMRGEPTAHDSSYSILTLLTMLAVLLIIPLLILYVVLIVKAQLASDVAELNLEERQIKS